jgi:hypothetical protein
MSEFNVVYLSLAVVLFTLLAMGMKRVVQMRVRARRRVVEQPNSHYTPPAVRAAESKHRWQSIELDRIHEINREEVVRLLAKVEAVGVDSLRDTERNFLDYVAKIAAQPPAPEPLSKRQLRAADLRHRPA